MSVIKPTMSEHLLNPTRENNLLAYSIHSCQKGDGFLYDASSIPVVHKVLPNSNTFNELPAMSASVDSSYYAAKSTSRK